MKKYIYLTIFGLIGLFLIYGCSWLKSYGKIRVLSRHEEKVSIQELEKNWQDYIIYYAGLSVDTAAAIMFDPKNDGKTLIGDRWIKIEDKETLLELIGWIRTYIQFDPRLWRILGPDEQFYGYLFFASDYAVIKAVDDKTMYVYDIESPLYIEDGADLWEDKNP
jgi:hypothetical protein